MCPSIAGFFFFLPCQVKKRDDDYFPSIPACASDIMDIEPKKYNAREEQIVTKLVSFFNHENVS